MATTKDLCPNCNSTNVRWRKRRWYDVPLNFIETMLSGATQINTRGDIGAMSRSYMDPKAFQRQEIEEGRKLMGRHTASLFWKCPDCKQSGEDYYEAPIA